ncbi:MAG: 2Fe-2S iron-sulfur cluster-binding protein, partial [Fidelibacterota bacterium]
MVKINLNGELLEVEEGKTLLQAARDVDVRIPTLCHHDMLEPFGACRLCTVEIMDGNKSRLVTSCNFPVTGGLKVRTDSEKVINARKTILELMLSRWPNVRVLRELGEELGVKGITFHREEVDERENACILCGMCVRVCNEIVGANVLGFANRGMEREITVPFDMESEACIACGACAYVCPTHAITLEDYRGREVLHDELVLGPRTPIHLPFMQAIPPVPLIDKESCINFKTGNCKYCEKVCEPEAIDHEMEDEYEEIEVGSIILATGYDMFDCTLPKQYGYGVYDNVITGLEFEKLCHAS